MAITRCLLQQHNTYLPFIWINKYIFRIIIYHSNQPVLALLQKRNI